MTRVLTHAIVAVVERFTAERKARDRRNRIIEDALRRLPFYATDSERAQAAGVIRESFSRLPSEAEDFEVRAAAEEAVRPVCRAVEKRLLDERLTARAVRQLSWGSDDRDKTRLRRECAEILAELPQDVSEAEAKEALEPTIREACKGIEDRQARKRREEQKVSLIQQGVAEVAQYLCRLKEHGEITAEEYWDSGFKAGSERTVKERLDRELLGDETLQQVKELVHTIVDGTLE